MTAIPRPLARRRSGFSLAELLIAIGILSVGLSMSAALFPAALKEHERAANDVLGNIICENALALGKVVLRGDNQDGSLTNWEIGDSQSELIDKTTFLGTNQNMYPTGNQWSTLGYFLLACKDGEVYRLLAVSYRNQDTEVDVNDKDGDGETDDIIKKGNVKLVEITATINGVDVTGANNLKIGSPLIIKGNGQFAKLVYVNTAGTVGKLDHAITNISGGKCYVVRQEDNNFTASPALSVLTVRTGLRK